MQLGHLSQQQLALSVQQPDCVDQAHSIHSPASPLASPDAGALQDSPVPRQSSSSSISSDAACICIISPEQNWAEDGENTALLTVDGHKAAPSSDMGSTLTTLGDSQKALAASIPTADSSLERSGSGLKQRMASWWAAVTRLERLAALRRMFAMGSLAGTASGIMAGLTGMGGEATCCLNL